mmetsp:Transcript_18328/g.61329  ORF Transcript_18328/g.61329 Transcript_18328/m.61329 type:complete len:202 (+) Transcript_18328:919-1524(+)
MRREPRRVPVLSTGAAGAPPQAAGMETSRRGPSSAGPDESRCLRGERFCAQSVPTRGRFGPCLRVACRLCVLRAGSVVCGAGHGFVGAVLCDHGHAAMLGTRVHGCRLAGQDPWTKGNCGGALWARRGVFANRSVRSSLNCRRSHCRTQHSGGRPGSALGAGSTERTKTTRYRTAPSRCTIGSRCRPTFEVCVAGGSCTGL